MEEFDTKRTIDYIDDQGSEWARASRLKEAINIINQQKLLIYRLLRTIKRCSPKSQCKDQKIFKRYAKKENNTQEDC